MRSPSIIAAHEYLTISWRNLQFPKSLFDVRGGTIRLKKKNKEKICDNFSCVFVAIF